jgi:beta-glucosidase-like glycosyl hydrolase
MASSTKTGVDLNLTQEARNKFAAKAKSDLEAKKKKKSEQRIIREKRRIGLKTPSEIEPRCMLKYEDKVTCLATGKPYSGNVRCKFCNRGKRF